ncbi:MAG: DUF4102 domain-containing protein [Sphingomonas sp.]|uniref:tyrosine-type recombinase/integrase n=1 Tax=Sphingomonas sp. TaxID=28214 RepID=UPI0011F879AB|nr:integrase family protein [Sphingomonas sp.]THD35025.1 MAG: DUF4102 domain-containing protein [Sphingomonas sp.]
MTKKQTFTPATIEALRSGMMADPQTPGLYVEAQTRGGFRLMWKYRRRVAGTGDAARFVKKTFAKFPDKSIADAREWAQTLNRAVEQGIDPDEATRAEKAAYITVGDARDLYMTYVRAGTRRKLKQRSIADKESMWKIDMCEQIGSRILQEITDDDLWSLVLAKGAKAPIRANRLAGEMKVFFKWCASREGKAAGIVLKADPAISLDAYYYKQTKRDRFLSHDEIGWLLAALADEERIYQRAILLLLLTALRRDEVLGAAMSEIAGSVWTIPGPRMKNHITHEVYLGAWGTALARTNDAWLIASDRKDGPRMDGWYKIRNRVAKRMAKIAGQSIPAWTYHDFRRTFRSNAKRLGIDYDTAEAVIAHKKTGLTEVYDRYDLADEKRDAYAKWEAFLIDIAVKVGVADRLGVPERAITLETAKPSTRDDATPSFASVPDSPPNPQLRLF